MISRIVQKKKTNKLETQKTEKEKLEEKELEIENLLSEIKSFVHLNYSKSNNYTLVESNFAKIEGKLHTTQKPNLYHEMVRRKMDKDKPFIDRIEKFSYILCILFQYIKLNHEDINEFVNGLSIPHMLPRTEDIPEFEFASSLVYNCVSIVSFTFISKY